MKGAVIMADSIEYTGLTIKISADSQEANKSVKDIKKSLTALDDTAKNLDTDQIKTVEKILRDIASIDFSNVAKGLQDVVTAFKQLNSTTRKGGGGGRKSSTLTGETTSNNFSNVLMPQFPNFEVGEFGRTIIDFKKELEDLRLEEINQKLESLNYTFQNLNTTLYDTKENLYSINNVFAGYKEYETLKQDVIDIRSAFEDMDNTVMNANQDLEQFNVTTGNFTSTIEVAKPTIRSIVRSFIDWVKSLKNTNDETKKGTTTLGKWLKRAKEIAKYRIIRKVIQEIYKALVQGIQGVAMFDDATNLAMSNIKTSMNYFVNSIGAMLSPLVQIFEPLLVALSDTLAEAGNTFAEFFAQINGQDTFAKAKKDFIDYRDTLTKTSIGIDELNILPQQDNFEIAQVDQTKEGMGDIKGIFTEIVGMIKELIELAKPFLSEIMGHIGKVLRPIMSIITNIVKLIKELVGNTFQGVNESLFSFVDMIGQIFNFIAEIVNALMPELMAIMNIISPILNIINGILDVVFDAVGGIFHLLVPIVKFVGILLTPLTYILTIVSTIFYCLEGIFTMFKNIFTFNWGAIASDWSTVGEKIKQAWDSVNSQQGIMVSSQLNGYATGGFPEDGFFFANHTELVGSFDNGKTAVANNEQITEGIYRAVLQAMRESGGQQVVINMDGQKVAELVTDKQDNFGASIIKGGTLTFGR